jgi:hypothetical protein
VTDETSPVPTPPPAPPSEPPQEPTSVPPSSAPPATPAAAPERDNGPIVLGGLLVVGGLALFAARALNLDLFSMLGWPSIIIGIGVIIAVVGLAFAREEGMVVGGTVVTTVGLVLWYQNQTDNWATWAYAWALVGPAASGLGIILWSLSAGDMPGARRGVWALLGGLAIFAVGFLFFEGVIGLSGDDFRIADWVLPVVVIAIGAVMLGRGLLGGEDQDPA